jgi:hypothetical protein
MWSRLIGKLSLACALRKRKAGNERKFGVPTPTQWSAEHCGG